MNKTPLVSVVTPTYRSVKTLPRAFASLLNQSYDNWEWLVIDDGSEDGTTDFLSSLNDSRIRAITLKENRGRGYVRNLALGEARGDLITSLDADDWLYSWKLSDQVGVFQEFPPLVAVTTGMLVTDSNDELVGTFRMTELPPQPLTPRNLKFPFGPTMVKTPLARQIGFDIRQRRGADMDFFLRLLCAEGRGLGVTARPGYVYHGHSHESLHKFLEGHFWSRKIYLRQLQNFPRDCAYLWLTSLLKSFCYRAALAVGLSDWLGRRRYPPPTPVEAREYQSQRRQLQGTLDSNQNAPL